MLFRTFAVHITLISRAMNYSAVEFRVEPDMERIGEDGFALRVEVTEAGGKVEARYWIWRGTLFGPPSDELRKQGSHTLEPARATQLFDELGSVNVAVTAPTEFRTWLHPITYRLAFHWGNSSTEFGWKEELPEEWSALSPTVKRLRQIAKEHDGEV